MIRLVINPLATALMGAGCTTGNVAKKTATSMFGLDTGPPCCGNGFNFSADTEMTGRRRTAGAAIMRI